MVFTLIPSDSLDKPLRTKSSNLARSFALANFNYPCPVHHTCPLDTSRDADACQEGDSTLYCLQRCTVPGAAGEDRRDDAPSSGASGSCLRSGRLGPRPRASDFQARDDPQL